jgi:hypothetical protein
LANGNFGDNSPKKIKNKFKWVLVFQSGPKVATGYLKNFVTSISSKFGIDFA